VPTTSQVKTLSFLTYLLRGSADWVRPHKEIIPLSVVQLLVNPETMKPQPETPHPNPRTPNPKPETRTPKRLR